MTGSILFCMFVGLAGGLSVGAGFVAFLTVLGVLPRLAQLTKTEKRLPAYEAAIILGIVFFGWNELQGVSFYIHAYILLPIGLADGIFNGMLAAALTEVINVFPILSKRIGLQDKVIHLVMALVLGKVAGSLFQWLYFVDL